MGLPKAPPPFQTLRRRAQGRELRGDVVRARLVEFSCGNARRGKPRKHRSPNFDFDSVAEVPAEIKFPEKKRATSTKTRRLSCAKCFRRSLFSLRVLGRGAFSGKSLRVRQVRSHGVGASTSGSSKYETFHFGAPFFVYWPMERCWSSFKIGLVPAWQQLPRAAFRTPTFGSQPDRCSLQFPMAG